MKHLLLGTLAFIAAVNSLFGQSYIPYHKEIIRAEELFLRKSYDSAVLKYRETFDRYRHPFVKDCFIAAEIACLAKDPAALEAFVSLSFEGGVNKKAFGYIGVFNTFVDSRNGLRAKVDSLYEVKRLEYIKHLDFPLRAEMYSIAKTDDIYKTIPLTWSDLKTNNALYAKTLDDLMTRYQKIVQTAGFPGERRIGVIDPELDGYCDNDLYFRLNAVSTLFLFHDRCGFPMLKKYLLEAVQNGNLHPREYALIYEWSRTAFGEALHHTDPSKNVFDFKNCAAFDDTEHKSYFIYVEPRDTIMDIIATNKNRDELGICSSQHDISKKKFAKDHNLVLLFGFAHTL